MARDIDDAPEVTESDLLRQSHAIADGRSSLMATRAHIQVLCAELKREQNLRLYAERRITEWQEAAKAITFHRLPWPWIKMKNGVGTMPDNTAPIRVTLTPHDVAAIMPDWPAPDTPEELAAADAQEREYERQRERNRRCDGCGAPNIMECTCDGDHDAK